LRQAAQHPPRSTASCAHDGRLRIQPNHFAVLGPITKVADFAAIGPQRIHLAVNGAVKQEAHLSGYYHLQPGDIIMTGTPAGVGAVVSTCRLRSDV
jgi:2-keto-4-pentenoate hydratase/2-oxohepta-3-ene-1,7-dioic acid hydratase in catechol pathway